MLYASQTDVGLGCGYYAQEMSKQYSSPELRNISKQFEKRVIPAKAGISLQEDGTIV
jgi:hypothetical protein